MEDAIIQYNGDYIPKRANKYNPLKEQLDALWHDIDRGLFGNNAKTGQFYMSIKAIKEEFPKEELNESE